MYFGNESCIFYYLHLDFIYECKWGVQKKKKGNEKYFQSKYMWENILKLEKKILLIFYYSGFIKILMRVEILTFMDLCLNISFKVWISP